MPDYRIEKLLNRLLRNYSEFFLTVVESFWAKCEVKVFNCSKFLELTRRTLSCVTHFLRKIVAAAVRVITPPEVTKFEPMIVLLITQTQKEEKSCKDKIATLLLSSMTWR